MRLQVEPALLDAVIGGTLGGMEMTGIVPVPIGASRLAGSLHQYSCIVGLVGRSSGTMALTMSQRVMRYLVGEMLGMEPQGLDDTTVDGVMEIGNMVAGCIKEELLGSDFEIARISLPSLIIGNAYNVVYARGMTTLTVQFSVDAVASVSAVQDHVFATTISLLRGSGS